MAIRRNFQQRQSWRFPQAGQQVQKRGIEGGWRTQRREFRAPAPQGATRTFGQPGGIPQTQPFQPSPYERAPQPYMPQPQPFQPNVPRTQPGLPTSPQYKPQAPTQQAQPPMMMPQPYQPSPYVPPQPPMATPQPQPFQPQPYVSQSQLSQLFPGQLPPSTAQFGYRQPFAQRRQRFNQPFRGLSQFFNY